MEIIQATPLIENKKINFVEISHMFIDDNLNNRNGLQVDRSCQVDRSYKSEEAEKTLICNQYISKNVCCAEIQTVISDHLEIRDSHNQKQINNKLYKAQASQVEIPYKVDESGITLICNQYISNSICHAEIQTDIQEFTEIVNNTHQISYKKKVCKTQACQVEIPYKLDESGTTLICNRYISKNVHHAEIQTEIKEFIETVYDTCKKSTEKEICIINQNDITDNSETDAGKAAKDKQYILLSVDRNIVSQDIQILNANNQNSDSSCMTDCKTFKQYKCPKCLYQSTSQRYLKNHLKIRHNAVQCFKCNEIIKSTYPSVYSRHLKKCGKQAHLLCKYCSFKGFYKCDIRKHIKKVHKFIDLSINDLIGHFIDLNEEYEIENLQKLTTHTVTSNNAQHLESTKMIKTDINIKLQALIEFTSIKDTFDNVNSQICKKDNNAASLKKSFKKFDLLRYYCSKCHETKKIIKTLPVRSQKKCKKCNIEMSCQCTLCNKMVTNYNTFDSHLRNVCNVKRFFKCFLCDYKTARKLNLQNHISLWHVEVNYVKCPKCNKNLKNYSSYLSKHNKKCGKKAHLKCAYCLFKGYYTAEVKSHIKKVHKSIDLSVAKIEDYCINIHEQSKVESLIKTSSNTISSNYNPESIQCSKIIENNTVSQPDVPFEFVSVKEIKSDDESNYSCEKAKKKKAVLLPIVCKSAFKEIQIGHEVLSRNEPVVQTITSSENLVQDNTREIEEIMIKEEIIENENLLENNCFIDDTNLIEKEINLSPEFNKNSSNIDNKISIKRNKFKFVNIDKILSNSVITNKDKAVNNNKISKLLKCDYCKKTFQSRFNLIRHITICKKTKAATGTDRATSGENSLDLIKCKDCGTTFARPYGLKRHIQRYCKMKPITTEPPDINYIQPKHILNKIGFINKYCPKCKRCRPFNKKFTAMKQAKCKMCNIQILWQCSKCNEEFQKFETICHHLQASCNNIKVYNCLQCDFYANDPENLKDHVQSKHPEKVKLTCSKCGKITCNPSALSKHLKQCGNKPNLNCKHCPFQAFVIYDIVRHLRRVHKVYETEMEKNYTDSNDTVRKIKIHKEKTLPGSGLINKYCPDCKRTFRFNSRNPVNEQKLCKKCNINIIWLCAKCNEEFESYQLVCVHVKTPCNNEQVYKCSQCDFKTQSSSNLQDHVRNEHFDKTKLMCVKCSEIKKDRVALSKHIKKCGNEPTLQCKKCEYQAYLIHEIKKHLKRVHHIDDNHLDEQFIDIEDQQDLADFESDTVYDAETVFVSRTRPLKKTGLVEKYCSKCKETKKISKIISISKQKICSDCNSEILWQCAVCKKQMNKYRQLTAHISVICNASITYQCAECDYTSMKKINLENHIFLRHMEINIIKCPKCNKNLKNYPSYLSVHKKKCGKKPHLKCVHCSTKTFYKSELKRHLKKVHKFIDLSIDQFEDQYVDISNEFD